MKRQYAATGATALAAGALALGLLAAGCSGSSKTTSAHPSASTAPRYGSSAPATGATTTAGATVALKNAPSLKKTILVDGRGRTLYLFEADKGTSSSCSGACASAWPPDTVTGTPRAGSGLNASLLATTKRADGTTQVTYGGHPLYRFSGDTKAGDTHGQGSKAFGAGWYVVGPDGKKIDTD